MARKTKNKAQKKKPTAKKSSGSAIADVWMKIAANPHLAEIIGRYHRRFDAR